MIPALLLASQAAAPLELARGVSLSPEYRYVEVEDTTLDRSQPDRAFGGDYGLVGDRDKAILIRFGDLRRAVGPNQRVTSAKLVLTPDSPDVPKLQSISRVLVPWGEGPAQVQGRARTTPVEWAATWRQRLSGKEPVAWQQAGAIGAGDTRPIGGVQATLSQDGESFTITGLGGAVQTMLDRPHENFGFALAFEGPSAFISSEGRLGKPRLVLEVAPTEPKADVPDLAVSNLTVMTGETGRTLMATVRNVGKSPAEAFSSRWTVQGRPGSSLEIAKRLGPGEETVVSLGLEGRAVPTDPRLGEVVFAITPTGPDADAANDAAKLYPTGRPVRFILEQGFLSRAHVAHPNVWALEQIRLLNDVIFPRSRFSFAPEGVVERLRLDGVTVIPEGATPGVSAEGAAIVFVTAADGALSPRALDLEIHRRVLRALGLIDLGVMNAPYSYGTTESPRGTVDRFPGLLGGGDTRFDGGVPGFFVLPYEPYSNPIFDRANLEPSGLLAATDVAALNAGVGKERLAVLTPFPTTVLLKATGLDGKPLDGAELAFFQSKDGKIDESAPAFTLITDSAGSVLLPNRTPESGSVVSTPNPFGTLRPDGSNGLFMIRASANGVSETSWLKAWQVVDAQNRGTGPARVFEVRFNLPAAPIDRTGNLALNRPVTDKAGSLPAQLAALVDGDLATEATLGGKSGDWIEIDLGRDRPIGEVRLVLRSESFWARFDLLGYGTGQEALSVEPWTRELDWVWTRTARRDNDPKTGTFSVAYRPTAGRYRYLRLINRAEGEPVKVAEIQIIPVRGPAGS